MLRISRQLRAHSSPVEKQQTLTFERDARSFRNVNPSVLISDRIDAEGAAEIQIPAAPF